MGLVSCRRRSSQIALPPRSTRLHASEARRRLRARRSRATFRACRWRRRRRSPASSGAMTATTMRAPPPVASVARTPVTALPPTSVERSGRGSRRCAARAQPQKSRLRRGAPSRRRCRADGDEEPRRVPPRRAHRVVRERAARPRAGLHPRHARRRSGPPIRSRSPSRSRERCAPRWRRARRASSLPAGRAGVASVPRPQRLRRDRASAAGLARARRYDTSCPRR